MVRLGAAALALTLASSTRADSSDSATNRPQQQPRKHPFHFLSRKDKGIPNDGKTSSETSEQRKQNDGNSQKTLALANPLPLASITPEFSINDELLMEPSVAVGDGKAIMEPILEEDFMQDEEGEDEDVIALDDSEKQTQAVSEQTTNQTVETGVSTIVPSAQNATIPKTARAVQALPFQKRTSESLESLPKQTPTAARWRSLRPLSTRGHLNLEVQSSVSPETSQKRTTVGARRRSLWREMDQSDVTKTTAYHADKAELVLDTTSAMSLIALLYKAVTNISVAFVGTLRLLAPMVFARRLLAYMAYVLSDWYTGRYLRKKYETFGQHYWRYYEVPAALRSVGRIATQMLVVSLVGHGAEWFLLVEIAQSCELAGGGCLAWCATTWLLVVLATARTVGSFIANQTPLRIKICTQIQPTSRRSRRKILLRPWFLIKWLRDPDALMRPENLIRSREQSLRPFAPNAMLFPASWPPLRFLQACAVCQCLTKQHVAGHVQSVHQIMRLVLVQEVMRGEWQRVLMVERRVALGIPVVSSYAAATLALFFAIGEVSGTSALLILPSLLAVLVSVWMNFFLYFERRAKKRTSHVDEQKHINQRLT